MICISVLTIWFLPSISSAHTLLKQCKYFCSKINTSAVEQMLLQKNKYSAAEQILAAEIFLLWNKYLISRINTSAVKQIPFEEVISLAASGNKLK